MENPLLASHTLPPFSAIKAEHVEPGIRELLKRNRAAIEQLLEKEQQHTWDSLLQPLESMQDELAQAWSPVSHLNSVCNTSEIRDAYNACLPLLSEYSTWLGQNEALYHAYQQIADSDGYAQLTRAQQTSIEHSLRDFRLSGVALHPQQKSRYAQLQQRLSELGSKFSENVLDATNAWSKQVSADELDGLPETALASARHAAEQAGQEGYLINLEFPSYLPVMTYCHNRALREEVYTAFSTRASDQGPHAGKWDNSALIEEILALRHELAQLLGFEHYAQLSLATKMADQPEQVLNFLGELAAQSHPQAIAEWQTLQQFAQQQDGVVLEAWDVTYYAEKLRQERYQLSQEDIRPYLPADRVLDGMFEVARRLYGIDVEEVHDFDSYHADARLFEIRQSNQLIARFYLELYARKDKRGGAWMDDCRVRRMSGKTLQLPVAYLACNFTAPVDNKPALLTHNELTTLFHEFGHGLHHMLTQQTVAAVSGINGVPWDAVELPSQFLENWCWEPEALAFISGHHETGEPLPQELLDKLLAARNFQAAMAMVRQLEFALFDFKLHMQWGSPGFKGVQELLDSVRSEVAVTPAPAFNRFQHSFGHIFAGGYAAGYYSYKWAEVLSADAFSRFEEDGIFNRDTGAAFQKSILESGGAAAPMDLFVAFRGREPDSKALLRHSGIRAA